MKGFTQMTLQETISQNVRKILNDRGLLQSYISFHSSLTQGQVSKILNLEQKMTTNDLSIFATVFSLSEIDLITYPEVYIPNTTPDPEPVEAILQIKLKKEKKDQVLKLVFGENDIEILNR